MRVTGIELLRGGSGCKAIVGISRESENVAMVEVNTALTALQNGRYVEMSLNVVRKARSIDANALMWHCISRIATALNADKWEVYKLMLARYTEGIPITCKLDAVERLQQSYRECERLGDVYVGGEKRAMLMLYVGSSQFDSKEMAHFIDCLIDEMREMGLETPTPERTREVIEAYERKA